jgi:Ser/Thr protein kinase RdoA (MazF antagonist)
VALGWLASFHAFHWEAPPPPGLWRDGCYWHLATRQEELASIGGRWGELKQHAAAINAAIATESPWAPQDGGGCARRHRTLCHGDFKSANFVFTRDGDGCAAYDFQYVGAGLGMKVGRRWGER